MLKKGFSKDRNGRWESARKLGEALALWLENHGVVEDVCNRSLHASWLPAERPTQPELAPFDQNAPPPKARSSSSPAMMPPPTLPSLRAPHRLSMWFAAAGFATLALALFRHSTSEDDTSLMVESKPADTRQQKGALTPDGIAAVEPHRTAQPSSRAYVPETEVLTGTGRETVPASASEASPELDAERVAQRAERAVDPRAADSKPRATSTGSTQAAAERATATAEAAPAAPKPTAALPKPTAVPPKPTAAPSVPKPAAGPTVRPPRPKPHAPSPPPRKPKPEAEAEEIDWGI